MAGVRILIATLAFYALYFHFRCSMLETLFILAGIAVAKFLYITFVHVPKNPLTWDTRRLRGPYEHDLKKRDRVLKQGFSINKVPSDLDAVVIGGGISGLTTAALLAKTGEKVLVLEQHDQAGGGCHTFHEKGYEFDAGIHYVGEMEPGCLYRNLVDHLTDGQVEFAPLRRDMDNIRVGDRQYRFMHGVEEWRAALLKQFPDEKEAVETYIRMLRSTEDIGAQYAFALLKLLPTWLVSAVVRTGLPDLAIGGWNGEYAKPAAKVAASLTQNRDLQTVMCYDWMDCGTPPQNLMFFVDCQIKQHFLRKGGWFPVGGASEIPYNMIPVIERSGGRVLVRANVDRILTDSQGRAVGVSVARGNGAESVKIFARRVVSSAGVHNTFQRLLPPEVAAKSPLYNFQENRMKPAYGGICVFIGFNASPKELGIGAENAWLFHDENSCFDHKAFLDSEEPPLDKPVPAILASFNSTKDPEWLAKDKTSCILITMANWSWFESFDGSPIKRRGDAYDEVKATIGHTMLEQLLDAYPQMRPYVDHVEVSTPLTNKHYLGHEHGQFYGLDFPEARFDPATQMLLRPQVESIPGLFLTGQDTFVAGFIYALAAGYVTASAMICEEGGGAALFVRLLWMWQRRKLIKKLSK